MIAREEVLPLLVAACPSFARKWADYRESAIYDAELCYLHLAESARHLIELAQSSQRAELDAVFAVVERLYLDGDEYVRTAATVGFLEALQSNARHAGLDPERFTPYLLPQTKSHWNELNRVWSGDPA